MSGTDTSVIHVHSLSSLTALLCHKGLLLQTNWEPFKSGGSRFQQQQALGMLSPSFLFVWLNQRLTKLNSKATTRVDQQYILKPWLLNAKPSLGHEYKWKK